MARQKAKQGGLRKEASLAVVGNGPVTEQHKKVFTPNDAEYHRYSKLLQGFFEKFTRWQEIFATDGHEYGFGDIAFSVYQSHNDLSLRPGTTYLRDDRPNEVLKVISQSRRHYNNPELGYFGTEFVIRPGPAGRHLLIDPEDREPLESVDISVSVQPHIPVKKVEIKTERPDIRKEGYSNYRQAAYRFGGNTLDVLHGGWDHYKAMSDEMAIKLINTIDALIPGGTGPTSQLGQKTPERAIPKLPAAGRRPAGR